MEHFAGLDVGTKASSLCVIDQDGEIIFEADIPTDPDLLTKALRPWRRSQRRVGHEAGSMSPWLHAELEARGVPVVCLEAYHARAAMRAQRNKTDRTDARGIAHLVRAGWFRSVHIKSDESYRLRFLLAQRALLVRKRVDVENGRAGRFRSGPHGARALHSSCCVYPSLWSSVSNVRVSWRKAAAKYESWGGGLRRGWGYNASLAKVVSHRTGLLWDFIGNRSFPVPCVGLITLLTFQRMMTRIVRAAGYSAEALCGANARSYANAIVTTAALKEGLMKVPPRYAQSPKSHHTPERDMRLE